MCHDDILISYIYHYQMNLETNNKVTNVKSTWNSQFFAFYEKHLSKMCRKFTQFFNRYS